MIENLNQLCSIVKKYGKDTVSFSIIIMLLFTMYNDRGKSEERLYSTQKEYIDKLNSQKELDEKIRRDDRMQYVNFVTETNKEVYNMATEIMLMRKEIEEMRKDNDRKKN